MSKGFYHALKINPERCTGCTHCVMECPTGALRIRNGKAFIHPNWCVDCAECMRSCPSEAIYVEQDDFNRIFDYQCRVALVPALFFAQFSKTRSEEEICSALCSIGFTHIVPVELTAGVVAERMRQKIAQAERNPSISPFCPAIARLLQIRFPDLTDNILNVKSPFEASATLFRRELIEQGVDSEQIGMFYVTPCAAKIAEVKGNDNCNGLIQGVLNMDFLYNKVYHIIQSHSAEPSSSTAQMPAPLSTDEMCWSQTGGEARHFAGRTLAIDEIHNVIEFIERTELTGEIQTVDFLELRACDRSCCGGVLAPANRFIASERLDKRAQRHSEQSMLATTTTGQARDSLDNTIDSPPYMPMAKLTYTGGIEEVLRQMNSVRNIMCFLPGIDCGACGSPGCQALAEDIVRGEAHLSNCIFMQRQMEAAGKLSNQSALLIMERVWGKERMEKNCFKKGAKYEGK